MGKRKQRNVFKINITPGGFFYLPKSDKILFSQEFFILKPTSRSKTVPFFQRIWKDQRTRIPFIIFIFIVLVTTHVMLFLFLDFLDMGY
jgi:hypothetical protein